MKSYVTTPNGGVWFLCVCVWSLFFFFSYKSDKSYTSSILDTLLQKVLVFANPVRHPFQHPFCTSNQALVWYNKVFCHKANIRSLDLPALACWHVTMDAFTSPLYPKKAGNTDEFGFSLGHRGRKNWKILLPGFCFHSNIDLKGLAELQKSSNEQILLICCSECIVCGELKTKGSLLH